MNMNKIRLTELDLFNLKYQFFENLATNSKKNKPPTKLEDFENIPKFKVECIILSLLERINNRSLTHLNFDKIEQEINRTTKGKE